MPALRKKIKSILLYFIVYSFLGWIIDTSYRSVLSGYFAPNSVTVLPFTPIYGFGALLIIWLSWSMKKRGLWQEFIVYALAATALEYAGALFSIRVLGRQLWDYSALSYNFNGHISLEHSIAWGVLGLFLVHYLHTFIKKKL